jgi:hypothetical protein
MECRVLDRLTCGLQDRARPGQIDAEVAEKRSGFCCLQISALVELASPPCTLHACHPLGPAEKEQ